MTVSFQQPHRERVKAEREEVKGLKLHWLDVSFPLALHCTTYALPLGQMLTFDLQSLIKSRVLTLPDRPRKSVTISHLFSLSSECSTHK